MIKNKDDQWQLTDEFNDFVQEVNAKIVDIQDAAYDLGFARGKKESMAIAEPEAAKEERT